LSKKNNEISCIDLTKEILQDSGPLTAKDLFEKIKERKDIANPDEFYPLFYLDLIYSGLFLSNRDSTWTLKDDSEKIHDLWDTGIIINESATYHIEDEDEDEADFTNYEESTGDIIEEEDLTKTFTEDDLVVAEEGKFFGETNTDDSADIIEEDPDKVIESDESEEDDTATDDEYELYDDYDSDELYDDDNSKK
jgi:DNA-directed RNA polymerase delta subunit